MTQNTTSNPPSRSDPTRDNDPNWRGGNPYLEYYRSAILKQEVIKMRQQDLFKMCHGCNDEVRNGQEYWQVRLGDSSITITVYFHADCYTRYKSRRPYDIKWAIHKPCKN